MKPVYKKIMTLLMLVALIAPVWAKTNEVKEAENRVLEVTRSIVKNLEQNKDLYAREPARLNAMIRKEVLPFIDFEAMSKLTLGKHWRKATPQQRQRFINAFREMLIRSYGKAMLDYAGATIRPGNSSPGKKPGYVYVRTIVTPKGRSSIAANYDVRKRSGDWKAYNVQIAGVNLITNFRTNFTREVTAKGLDALIQRLENTQK